MPSTNRGGGKTESSILQNTNHMQDNLISFIPFEKLRGRTLIWIYLLTAILCGMISSEITKAFSDNASNPMPEIISLLLFYVLYFIIISPILFRSKLSYTKLFGAFPQLSTIKKYVLWTVPLVIFSYVMFYLQFLPVHHLMPEIADWWFIDRSELTTRQHLHNYFFAQVLEFFTIVLVAPIVEEFFVRGIMLTRWSIKWGTPKAILVSSFLFAILHSNIIGAFFFGFVMSVLYIRTKSLFMPIVLHIANNFTAWAIDATFLSDQDVQNEASEMVLNTSETMWILAASVIIVPWAIRLIWKNLPNHDWHVPYFIDAPYL